MTAQMPPLPPHDPAPAALVPAATAAQWPVGAFLENLAIVEDGTVFCSVHPSGEIFTVAPGVSEPRLLGTIGGPAAGLVVVPDGRLFVMSGYPGQAPASVWVMSMDGKADHWIDVPDGAFLNGAALFGPDALLVVDSLKGAIFRVDTGEPAVAIWYRNECLTQRPDTPLFPAANGIKQRAGSMIVSNTDRAQIFDISITADGGASAATLIAERLLFDDFALGPDGALYGCAHAYNQLVRLAPDGTRTVLAGAEQGVVNPTAAAFGRATGDTYTLYVTSTGGVAAPLPTGLEPARLTKLDLSGLLGS